jgi:hypothetical protein
VVTEGGSVNRDTEQRPAAQSRPPRFSAPTSGALALLLSSSLLLVPLLGLVIAPLGLVPVAQQVVAGRRSYTAWGWVVAGLAVLALMGVTLDGVPAGDFLLAYLLAVVLPIASIELWLAVGCTEGRWAALTTLVGSVSSSVVVVARVWPQAPLEALATWWQDAAASIDSAEGSLGVPSGQLELFFDTIAPVFPWFFATLPVAYLVTLLFWIRPRLPVIGLPLQVEPFERFRFDEWLAVGFAFCGIGALLLDGTPKWVAVNLLIGVLILYFVQGLAIIRAHLARWIGRGWLVRWGVALFCLQIPIPIVVAALGIADGFFSLRPRPSDNGGNT